MEEKEFLNEMKKEFENQTKDSYYQGHIDCIEGMLIYLLELKKRLIKAKNELKEDN